MPLAVGQVRPSGHPVRGLACHPVGGGNLLNPTCE